MISIRGATTIEKDETTEIISNTELLLTEIIKRNNLQTNKIISVFFTCTKDITSAYPARAARLLGLNYASLMCLQEMYVEGSLDKCIRVCIFYNDNIEQALIRNVYLNNAKNLRPDWSIEI